VFFGCYAVAQGVPSSRLTFSGGWSRQLNAPSYETQTATGLGLSYGYRLDKYLEAEAGLFTALDPTGDICAHFGCLDVNDRYFWIPFGVRFIAPLHRDRVELSAGGGGLYEKYTVANPFPGGGPAAHSGWGGYFAASAGIAATHSRRFWVAATPRWFLANAPYARDRWFQIAAELTYRF
jgi:hypothetical protein